MYLEFEKLIVFQLRKIIIIATSYHTTVKRLFFSLQISKSIPEQSVRCSGKMAGVCSVVCSVVYEDCPCSQGLDGVS